MNEEHRAGHGEEPPPRHASGDVDVTASEIAAFAYCAKAWHLEHVGGKSPSPDAARARDAGTTRHQRHGADVRLGSWLVRNSRWALPALAALAAIFGALALLVG